MRRPQSLKGRLTLLALAALAAGWLAAAAFTWRNARHEVDELLDGHLAQIAALIVVQLGHEADEIDTEHAPLLHKYARQVSFQVWDGDGRLRLHSANAPNRPLADGRPGLSETEIAGERWRVFSARGDASGVLVHVGERISVRRHLADELAAGMLGPLLAALPMLAALLWLAVGRGLRPLERVAGEVATRSPEKLSPLASADMPTEIRPLAERLNGLFARVASSIEQERRFTADAAHELRTPLAAIRAQAQVAEAAAASAERQRALAAVIAGCDRAARLVAQLLTLARVDAAPPAGRTTVELRTLAIEALADLAGTAGGKSIDLDLAEGPQLRVGGYPELLRVLLRNLLDNAVRYAPPGSAVSVRVEREPSQAVITVSDDGPGIPPAERSRVCERFYRVLGSGEEGSGLGLAIVARIAELHDGRIEFDTPPSGKGLEVRVVLPGD